MESLGQYLKTQRELRDVSILDVSNETKIGINWIEAMESDNWDVLPCKTFARGFLKAYAKSLGLETEEVVTRYDDLKNCPESGQKDIPNSQCKSSRKIIWLLGAAAVVAAAAALFIWII